MSEPGWQTAEPGAPRWVWGLVAVLVIGLVGAWIAREGVPEARGRLAVERDGEAGRQPAPAPPARDPEPASTAAPRPRLAEAGGRWREEGDAPVNVPAEHAGVWTDRELVVLGDRGEAAAWSPAHQRWRELPPVPLSPRHGSQMAWAGGRVVVFGGSTGGPEPPLRDGAAYDPASDSWTPIEEPPALGEWTPVVVGAGDTVVVWAGSRPGDAHKTGAWRVGGSAYDLVAQAWRSLPPAPVPRVHTAASVAADGGVYVWGEHFPETGVAPYALAYDLRRDVWRRLADPPLDAPSEAAAVWTGDQLVLWGVPLSGRGGDGGAGVSGAAYDAASDRWTVLPRVPGLEKDDASLYGFASAWTGRSMIVHGGYPRSLSLAYTPAEQRWRQLPAGGGTRVNAVAAWTGQELLLWGGYTAAGPTVDLRAWRFGP